MNETNRKRMREILNEANDIVEESYIINESFISSIGSFIKDAAIDTWTDNPARAIMSAAGLSAAAIYGIIKAVKKNQ